MPFSPLVSAILTAVDVMVLSFVVGILSYLLYLHPSTTISTQPMLNRLSQLTRTVRPLTPQTRTMSTTNGLPSSWHSGPDDSFHGKITPDGPFKPEKDRYHLYIGLF